MILWTAPHTTTGHHSPYDVFVIDLHMPDMMGTELAEALRELAAGLPDPVLEPAVAAGLAPVEVVFLVKVVGPELGHLAVFVANADLQRVAHSVNRLLGPEIAVRSIHWAPDGFEVKVVGSSGSRKVWTHLVIETQSSKGRLAAHTSTVITSTRDM